MKKIHITLLFIVAAIVAFSACSSSETYADKLKKEKKAIKRFISDNGIETVNISYLQDRKEFADNQYYKDPTGVYYRVISYGDQDFMASTERNTEVSLRHGPILDIANNSDTLDYGNLLQSTAIYLMTFRYGNANTYQQTTVSTSSTRDQYLAYYFLSPGIVLPLEYVGDGGSVSMLVPFTAGSYYQNYSSYEPLFYTQITYHF